MQDRPLINKFLFVSFFIIAFLDVFSAVLPKFYQWEVYFKPLLMPVLLLYGFSLAKEKNVRLPILLITALFFGWLGDIFLLIAHGNIKSFITGLLAFLAGHICYVILNLKAEKKFEFRLIYVLVSAPLLGVAYYFVSSLAKVDPVLAFFVGAYSLVLYVNFIASFTLIWRSEFQAGATIFIGSTLFVISDALVAMNRFLVHTTEINLLIMPTYILAQYLIMVGNIRKISTTNQKMAEA